MGVLFRAGLGLAIAFYAHDPESARDWLREDLAPLVRPECGANPCAGHAAEAPFFSLAFLTARPD